jgi:PKD repeat protein
MKKMLFAIAGLALIFNSCGKKVDDTIGATPSLTPTACFTTEKSVYKLADKVEFKASCSKNVGYYLWDFGDKTPVTAVNQTMNPVHLFVQNGNYNVKLTVWNSDKSEKKIMSMPIVVGDRFLDSITIDMMPASDSTGLAWAPTGTKMINISMDINSMTLPTPAGFPITGGQATVDPANPRLTIKGFPNPVKFSSGVFNFDVYNWSSSAGGKVLAHEFRVDAATLTGNPIQLPISRNPRAAAWVVRLYTSLQ